jgi:hypothetical protein
MDSRYECGTCGSLTLVIEAVWLPAAEEGGWRIHCDTGHVWIPVPGTVITVTGAAPQSGEPMPTGDEFLKAYNTPDLLD